MVKKKEKRYVVARKCHAIEWVFVDATTEKEAVKFAKHSDDVACGHLEFAGYQDIKTWTAEELAQPKPSEVRYGDVCDD
jgi:hypothetical protein